MGFTSATSFVGLFEPHSSQRPSPNRYEQRYEKRYEEEISGFFVTNPEMALPGR
jgi:hypothetical protein